MAIDLRTATPDDLEALVVHDFRNFGATVEEGDVEEVGEELDLSRFLLAWDGERMAGAAGSYDMELTVPGGATIPMSGVTWVSVSATHRRRGIAARLMAGLDELSTGFGEPLLGLTASEAGIYERFGYGVSTQIRVTEIDRRRASIARDEPTGPVELVTGRDHTTEMHAIWDRFRRQQPGEVSRSPLLQRIFTLDRKKPTYVALHADGYAVYSIEPRWDDGHPAHRLNLGELVAVTPAAHVALWNVLLSVDLVGPIRSTRSVSLDDPLPYLLDDPRALRTVELNDGLWLKVTDPVRCFTARTYRSDDRMVIGIVESSDDLAAGTKPQLTISVGRDGSRTVEEEPDLVACRSALGPLLLGFCAGTLAAGHRLRGTESAVERADVLFGTGRLAHCRTPF